MFLNSIPLVQPTYSLPETNGFQLPSVNDERHVSAQLDDGRSRRVHTCRKCDNHGVKSPIRGHTRCPFKLCVCAKCEYVASQRCEAATRTRIRRKSETMKGSKSTLTNEVESSINLTTNLWPAMLNNPVEFPIDISFILNKNPLAYPLSNLSSLPLSNIPNMLTSYSEMNIDSINQLLLMLAQNNMNHLNR